VEKLMSDKAELKSVLLGCVIEPSYKERFAAIAKAKHMTVSEYLRQMIMKILDKEAKK
jgi:hypothetical protein